MNNSIDRTTNEVDITAKLDRPASEMEMTPMLEKSTLPNIFDFAPSELSQDAFLCWLLSWANTDYADSDPGLHECALELIRALIKKHEVSVPDRIEKIEVFKQYFNIDVLCIVNDEIVILIEDKTDSMQHSGQLARYLKFAESQFQSHRILPIYFKTGDQSDYSEIVQDGYQVFSRQDFLQVLNSKQSGECSNAIFQDYRKYLQSISNAVNAYLVKPVQDWNGYAWEGFFMKLQKELCGGFWGDVPNPRGGFTGFWWHFHPQDHCEIYLQLEESKLCFKVEVNDPANYGSIRNFWHEEILRVGEDFSLNIVKPKFGHGAIMTFAVLRADYREVDSNGILDLGRTIKTLKEAEMLLNAISNSSPV